jgi:hypothetical protein
MTLARQAGHEPMPIPRVPRTRAMGTFPFDAAGRGRRGIGWNPPTLGLNTLLFSHGLELQARNRDAVRNSAWAAAAVDSCHACGEGAKSDAKKPEGMAPLAGVAALAGVPLRMRPEGDIEAIGALCKMAGCPDKAAEFLTKKKPNGQYFSVADISEELTAARVIESEKSMITSHVSPNQGAVGSLQEIEAQATTYARQNRGKETSNLYAERGTTKLTKERAYAQMLEEHPEVYGAFVAQHNAKGLIDTLERAGVRLAR